ncbi:hypothetical protein MPL3365_150163 [Mesorhizobium plurifarium]|uniref:Uncharacterized protein n=1 Tax=Mesorhizobium plurifarium TaxID=69974 RepID=A0A090FYA4_MESPL|nr:hypothetical protein MPL3365_150163 [Mesorhizobium plurifarium]
MIASLGKTDPAGLTDNYLVH